MTQSALAVEGLTADDIHIEAVDREVEELTIAPTITLAWADYPAIDDTEVRFRADGPGRADTVIDWRNQSPDNTATDGTVEFDCEMCPLLEKNGGPLKTKPFEPDPGEKTETNVTILLDLQIYCEDGECVEEQIPAQTVTYTVVVNHVEGEVTVSGDLNTGTGWIGPPGLLPPSLAG